MADKRQPDPLAFAGIGLELAGTVGVLTGIGWLIDQHFGSLPIATLTGAGIGIVGGLARTVIVTTRAMRKLQRPRRNAAPSAGDNPPPRRSSDRKPPE